MSHMILVAEGYTDSLRRFEEDFHGITLPPDNPKDEPGRMRVREVKLYTISYNRRCKRSAMAVMHGGLGINWLTRKKDLRWLRLKVAMFFGRIVLRIMRISPLDPTGIRRSDFVERQRKSGRHYLMHGWMLGELKDQVTEDGEELV